MRTMPQELTLNDSAVLPVLAILERQGITYQRHDHPPVFTCEEARRVTPDLPGAETKNLFLRDGKGKRHFLLGTLADKKVSLKELSSTLGISGLGLASPERLKVHLGLEPGAVTLLGVLNDKDGRVELLIDEELWRADTIQCHPLVNTSTLVLQRTDLEKLFIYSGHIPHILKVPGV